jgi:hypothetical protein
VVVHWTCVQMGTGSNPGQLKTVTFHVTDVLLFILYKEFMYQSCVFFEDLVPYNNLYPILSGSSMTPNLHIHMTAMVVLSIVRN